MGTGPHDSEVGRRVLAESIALQHTVAADLAETPLPPVARQRRRPVALDIVMVAMAMIAIAACGYFVV